MDDELDARLARISSSADVDELLDVGCDLAEAGRLHDAERCFATADDLGSPTAAFNLGNTLGQLGRGVEAVTAYERALAGGETDAWLNLGNVLKDLGDLAGAMHAYRGAAAAGDSNGSVALAFCLREQGERDEAMAVARTAATAGNEIARAVVACWEWCRTLDPSLEPELRAGAEHFPSARADLGDLLRSTGRVAEAREVLERGTGRREVECWLPLGNLLSHALGDEHAAEAAYRSGITAGDTFCHNNLGVLLEERGDERGAEEQCRLGAAAGDALAERALRDLLTP
ncbi:tetratricopeptide repeat protein [Sanguibacter sp. 25GB23B1]|uniref:tetratricopeptide repeat protein n=1 Tax=unclassified Sanguibacter TaxID=2645534 RepID=UPI0032AF5EFF